MTVIQIVAGGPSECLPVLSRGSKEEIWIAVDGGLNHLLDHGIDPDFIMGDFDSLKAEYLPFLKKISHQHFPSEKDETDLELAIMCALKQLPRQINIYGATGGRLDHFLVNVQLLVLGINSHSEVYIVDKKNRMTLKKSGCYQITKGTYQYVSFLSMYQYVDGLTLQGFKYPLTNTRLNNGSSLCISNELIEKSGTYSFDTGIVIVVESSD